MTLQNEIEKILNKRYGWLSQDYHGNTVKEITALLEKNIGMLRQWLNEERITDSINLVTDEQIKVMLGLVEPRTLTTGNPNIDHIYAPAATVGHRTPQKIGKLLPLATGNPFEGLWVKINEIINRLNEL